MWILATVLGILLFFLLLLAIPVDLVFCVEKEVAFKSRVRVGWMFGLIAKDISGKKEPEKEKRKRKRKRKDKSNTKPLLAMFGAKGFLLKLLGLVRDILRLLNIRELEVNLRVGLDDPAETGLLFALVGPALVCAKSFSALDVQVEPDFEQENLQGYCKGDFRAFPIRFAGLIILFAFSPTTIRAIKAIVVARRKWEKRVLAERLL